MQVIYGVTSGENIIQAFTEENTTEANFHQSINNAAVLTFTTTEPLKSGVQFFLTKDPINDYKNEEFMYFEITDQDFDGYEHTYRAEEYAYHDLDTMGYVKRIYHQGTLTTKSLLESITYNDVEPKDVARTKWEIIDNDLTLPTTWAGEDNGFTLWYNTPLRGIEKFIEYFGGEIRFYVTILDNKISRHYLEIYEKRGRETGKRYESNSNLISLTNKAEYGNRYEYIIPLAEGGGTSGDEQKYNTPNGYNNYITLEGLEVGKSTDNWYKPKSQMYISLANDKDAYPLKAQPKGLQNNPRIKPVTFQEIKSKEALFDKAIEWLENNQGVAWSYSASVLDIGESQVGDTIAIIDERSGISSYVRVHDIDYDMIDPENTGVHFGSNWGYENDEAITDMLNTATTAQRDTIGLIDTAIRQSNGKNTNYYGDNEPADPIEGDLWYWRSGDESGIKIYHNGDWVPLVDSNTLKRINEQVDKATSEANSYADSLNATQASEAAAFQSEANAALSSAAAERTVFSNNAASMATSAATHADSMANSAATYGKAQASNALSQAQSELATAKQELGSEVSKAQSDIITTNRELAGKVSQTDYNAKTDDLTKKYGQVKATADAVTTDVAKYKTANDGKVSANEANIETLSGQITSKVSQTDFDKRTGELSGKYTETKQTVDSISNTVTELQDKVNQQGQINQLMNTEFNPDTENWTLKADNGSRAPYKSFATYGSNGIGFNTVGMPTNTFASLQQTVILPNTRLNSDVMSLSWRVNTRQMDNYCHIWLYWQDANGKDVSDRTMGNWNDTRLNQLNVLKWENISVPIEAKQVLISFDTREGTNAYIFQPMLTFEKVVGDYVQGNYNNNARVAALEVDLDGITGLVNDPKKGLSATATLAANGLSVATTAKNDASTAIQTAKGVQTKVEQMGGINLLINTEFNPDLEGWELTSDGGDTRLPYRSYLSKDINATTVGFNTMNSATSSWSNMSQTVQLSSTATSGTTISLSWSSWARDVANYNGLHIYFYDNKDTKVGDEYREWTTRGGGGTENSYAVRKKWENITVPDTATYLILKFQAREGTGAYLAQPMLVFGSTIGDYVAGPYNNNNSLESTRTQLADQITDEIKDRKDGDESVVTQTTKLIDQRVKSVEKGYESAISQSADMIMASVSTPNLLLNTNFTPDLENWNITQHGGTTNDTFYRSILDDQGHTAVGVNIPDDAGSDSNKHYAQFEQDIRMPGWKNNVKLSLSWRIQVRHMLNYAWLWVTFLNDDKSVMKNADGSTANAGYNYGATGNNADGKWHDGKFENISVPDGCVYIRISFQAREGTNLYLTSPMATFTSKAQSYTAGSYSGMNTQTVLTLAKDNWALGITDNAGRIISGINGDKSGTVIQGNKLIVNSDTTFNGNNFMNAAIIKDGSIGTAKIGNLAVTSAKINDLNVDKLTGNVSSFIKSKWDSAHSNVTIDSSGLEINTNNQYAKLTEGSLVLKSYNESTRVKENIGWITHTKAGKADWVDYLAIVLDGYSDNTGGDGTNAVHGADGFSININEGNGTKSSRSLLEWTSVQAAGITNKDKGWHVQDRIYIEKGMYVRNAPQHFKFGWTAWSDWGNFKNVSLTNGEGTAGIAVNSNNLILFGTGKRTDGTKGWNV